MWKKHFKWSTYEEHPPLLISFIRNHDDDNNNFQLCKKIFKKYFLERVSFQADNVLDILGFFPVTKEFI